VPGPTLCAGLLQSFGAGCDLVWWVALGYASGQPPEGLRGAVHFTFSLIIFLVFGRDGSGGAWYSDNSRPAMVPENIKINMSWERMTAADAQTALDNLQD